MSNKNIFLLTNTPTHHIVTCKECGDSLPVHIQTDLKTKNSLLRKFRRSHEKAHEVSYDPRRVVDA